MGGQTKSITVIPDSFNKINNLKFLQTLILKNYIFEKTFKLKLFNLKKLKLSYVKNIEFYNNSPFQLKNLFILKSKVKEGKKINFSELESLSIEEGSTNIFNFDALKNLKKLIIESYAVLRENNIFSLSSLEEIEVKKYIYLWL